MQHGQTYSSSQSHRFAQLSPRKDCPSAAWHLVQTLHQGYRSRCDKPRCCFPGMDWWAYKNRMCEARLMDYIHEDMSVYRGSLTMPKDASPDEHVNVRRNFRQILDRWKSPKNYTVEMRGLLHIVDPLNAHWDLLAYSDAPEKPLKAAVADAWHRAGGKYRGWSLEPTGDDELAATIKYQNKDTVNPETARRYLPETQANMGMKFIWHTRRFWAGRSQKALWGEWVAEWYPKGKGGAAPILDNMFRLNIVAELRALTPYAEDYLRQFPWHTPEGQKQTAGDLEDILKSA